MQTVRRRSVWNREPSRGAIHLRIYKTKPGVFPRLKAEEDFCVCVCAAETTERARKSLMKVKPQIEARC